MPVGNERQSRRDGHTPRRCEALVPACLGRPCGTAPRSPRLTDVSERLPRGPGTAPLDRRVAAVYVVLILALVAPGVGNLLSPLDDTTVGDAASSLESHARSAIVFIDRRRSATDALFGAELQDVARATDETRSELLRQAVASGVAKKRDDLADAASSLSDAIDDASRAGADEQRLQKDRSTLEALATKLKSLGSGS
jgi:hypothetical protein